MPIREGQKLCGAKTQRGKGPPCQDIAMKNGRCKRHGGKTPPKPVGFANPSTKLGIYSRVLSAADRAIYDDVALGSVDDELRLIRLRLHRTVKARRDWEESRGVVESTEVPGANGDEVDHHVFVERVDDESVTKDGDVVPTTKKTFRLPDFDKIEQACLARIESLEKTRLELAQGGGGKDDSPGIRIIIEGGLPKA